MKLMQSSKQSSGTMVSGFKKSTYSPLILFNTLLLALANPALVMFQINCTVENLCCRYSLLPSVERLSITKISASILSHALMTEQRHCSKKYFTLKFTMTTDNFKYCYLPANYAVFGHSSKFSAKRRND